MTKDIKDYMHYYQNINVKISSDRKAERKLDTMIYATGEYAHCTKSSFPYSQDIPYKNVTPFLRPLSDMTEEEKAVINGERGNPMSEHLTDALIEGNKHFVKLLFESFELFHYLLKRGFDLFGLIEAGLAIDKTQNQ